MTSTAILIGFFICGGIAAVCAWFICECFERALDVEGEGE